MQQVLDKAYKIDVGVQCHIKTEAEKREDQIKEKKEAHYLKQLAKQGSDGAEVVQSAPAGTPAPNKSKPYKIKSYMMKQKRAGTQNRNASTTGKLQPIQKQTMIDKFRVQELPLDTAERKQATNLLKRTNAKKAQRQLRDQRHLA